MDGIRTVITTNSVWKIDTTLCHYVRFPREEAPGPGTVIPYTSQWEPYTSLERYGDRIIVHRPVAWGQGAMRMTGAIEWDDLEADDLLAHVVTTDTVFGPREPRNGAPRNVEGARPTDTARFNLCLDDA